MVSSSSTRTDRLLTKTPVRPPGPSEEEKTKEAENQLWKTELANDEETGPEPLPKPNHTSLVTREHGFYGRDPVVIKPGDMKDLSLFRQQFCTVQRAAFTLAPIITAADIERHLNLSEKSNIFNTEPIASNTGRYLVPSQIDWGYDVQKGTQLRKWISHFQRYGIIICHKIVVPSMATGQEIREERQITLTNPGGETVVWFDAESKDPKHNMVSPIRVMLADPQNLKIDCETDFPGSGYQKTHLPNTVSAPAFFRLYFSSDIPDDEDFARHWLKQEDLAPKPSDAAETTRFMFSVQQTRMTTLAILKRLRTLYLPGHNEEKLNLLPILRDAIITLLGVRAPGDIVMLKGDEFQIPRPLPYPKPNLSSLSTVYNLIDESEVIIRAVDISIPTPMMPPGPVQLPYLRSCTQYAEKIWKRMPLPVPTTIARVGREPEIPHFCATCGDPRHRRIHCEYQIDLVNRCAYPLCPRKGHVTMVCPALHQICRSCGRRGHDRGAHNLFTPMQLDGIFYWWSPLGVYTCIVFLENSPRKAHLQDWHWKLSLHNVQRNVAQNAFPILGFNYTALPEYKDVILDPYFSLAPIWQFAPNLREAVLGERENRVERAKEEALQKEAKEVAQAQAKLVEDARAQLEAEEEARQSVAPTLEEPISASDPDSNEMDHTETEPEHLPEHPITIALPISSVSILDPTTEMRLAKLIMDAQVSHMMANQLGVVGSPPVLLSQSHSNQMIAMAMELQTCRKEREALEAQNQILRANDQLRAQEMIQIRNELQQFRAGQGSEPLLKVSPFQRLGPQVTNQVAVQIQPLDMAAELSVGRPEPTKRAPTIFRNPGKRQRDRLLKAANKLRDASVTSVVTKKARSDLPNPAPIAGPSQAFIRPLMPPKPRGRGTTRGNYRGQSFDPNYRGRGQTRGQNQGPTRGQTQGPTRGQIRGRGQPAYDRGPRTRGNSRTGFQ